MEDSSSFEDTMNFGTDDVIVATYNKCGTTWAQDIIWELRHGPGTADSREKTFDEIELPSTGYKGGKDEDKNCEAPQLLHTRLDSAYFKNSLDDESSCPKFIYVMRNPNDAAVSNYYHHVNQMIDDGEIQHISKWDDFFELFMNGHVKHGNIFDHVASWWKYREHPCVLILTYEEMKNDLRRSVEKIANFLECDIGNHDMDGIVKNTTLKAVKQRAMKKYASFILEDKGKTAGKLFRKGKGVHWKEVLSPKQQLRMEESITAQYMAKGIDCY